MSDDETSDPGTGGGEQGGSQSGQQETTPEPGTNPNQGQEYVPYEGDTGFREGDRGGHERRGQ